MKKLQVSRNLIAKIAEIYEETSNSIKISDKTSNRFWTSQGVRQACPLSPIRFSIYMTDIEEYLNGGKRGGVVICKMKIWSLSYADDIVVFAKIKQEMNSIIKRLTKYIEKKWF